MTRHIDWQKRLRRVIEVSRTKPHDWNGHCCASFSLKRCYFAVTGRLLPCNYFFKTYASEDEANEVLAQMGCTDVEDLADTFLQRRGAPGLICRGDIAVVMNEGRKALAVCVGTSCVAPGPKCLHMVPNYAIIAAFEVN